MSSSSDEADVTEVTSVTIGISLNDTSFADVLQVLNGSDPVKRNLTLAKVEIAVLAVMFTTAVVGNSLAVLALILHRSKLSRMHYFILHLCISDLVVAFFHILPQMVLDILGGFIGGYPGDAILCKLVKYLQMLGPYSSSYILSATAIDRYQAICFPLMNCSWTPRRSKIMVCIAWALSLLFCLPQVFVFNYFYGEYQHYDCYASFVAPWGERVYVLWATIAIFIVPLLILIYTYSCICRVIVINFRQKSGSNCHQHNSNGTARVVCSENHLPKSTCQSGNAVQMNVVLGAPYRFKRKCQVEVKLCKNNNSANRTSTSVNNVYPRTHSVTGISRAKMKTIKLTVIVIVCYVVCSMPYFSSMLYVTWYPEARHFAFTSSEVFTILALLASLNSCVNPWLYLAFNENLTKTLKDLFFCHLHHKKQSTFSHANFSRSSLSETKSCAQPSNMNHNVFAEQVCETNKLSVATETVELTDIVCDTNGLDQIRPK